MREPLANVLHSFGKAHYEKTQYSLFSTTGLSTKGDHCDGAPWETLDVAQVSSIRSEGLYEIMRSL